MGALDGVRVLEFARVSPVAFCTRVLADLGAEVIRVESPARVSAEGFGRSVTDVAAAASDQLNRNKQSICLDLKQTGAREVLLKLAAKSDIFIEGFRPGVADRLGVGYTDLQQVNERLIYCAMSGFGQDGPYRLMPGHDLNYLAQSGVLGLIGTGERPTIPLNLVADLGGASMHALVGILAALIARQHTGSGQMVDISYLDATLSLLSGTPVMREFLRDGTELQRRQGMHSARFPYYTIYETKDRELLTLACVENSLWAKFCAAVDRPDLLADPPGGADLTAAPTERQVALKKELGDLFAKRNRDEWFDLLTSAGVPVGKVYALHELSGDEQLRARGMWPTVLAGPGDPGVEQPGLGINLSGTPWGIRSRAPVLGEHSEQILTELGYGPDAVADLRRTGAI